MSQIPAICRPISLKTETSKPFYSICTLVTRPQEYGEMCDSFVKRGFSPEDTEFLYLDNSVVNSGDAYAAYNVFLAEATSPYVVLCHQDIVLLDDGRDRLDEVIRELDGVDPKWALFGNAGLTRHGHMTIRISDPGGENLKLGGPFPQRVLSLDENFIVVRKRANIGLSHDLAGFHMYGADLCVMANIQGLNAYAVDFHLRHKSGGKLDRSYHGMQRSWERKYRNAFRSRFVPLVFPYPVFLTGQRWLLFLVDLLRTMGLRKVLIALSRIHDTLKRISETR